MAHGIDFSKGFAAFTAVGRPAWHGLGQIVEALTPGEALEKGGLDFDVVVSPNVHRYPLGIEPVPIFPEVVSQTSFFTWRTDTGGILGDKLGGYYTPLQNRDAFNLITPLCDLGVTIETAGALWGGRIVFILLNMGEYKVAGVDPVKTYLLYCNAHDGSKTVSAYFTDTRVVCWNTLCASLFGAEKMVKVRHTQSVNEKTEQALEWMTKAEVHKRKALDGFGRLVDTPFSEKRFFDYVANVFLDTSERAKLNAGDPGAISTRKTNILKAFLDYAQFGPGQQEFIGTAWGAYNGVTGYLGNVANYKDQNTRMDSLLWGAAAKVNEKALLLATHPEQIEPLSTTATPNFQMN